jgi:hypothetical protein
LLYRGYIKALLIINSLIHSMGYFYRKSPLRPRGCAQ